jgi:hypothetical protein
MREAPAEQRGLRLATRAHDAHQGNQRGTQGEQKNEHTLHKIVGCRTHRQPVTGNRQP